MEITSLYNSSSPRFIHPVASARQLTNPMAITVYRSRHRGVWECDEFVFIYCRCAGEDAERCDISPLREAQTADELYGKVLSGCPGLQLIAKGSLSRRLMRFDSAPPDPALGELVVRSFAIAQMEDYTRFGAAKIVRRDVSVSDSLTIDELLRLYGQFIPTRH